MKKPCGGASGLISEGIRWEIGLCVDFKGVSVESCVVADDSDGRGMG